MSEGYECLQKVLVEVVERDVVSAKDRGNERSNIGLSNDFLLSRLEHLYRHCIDERRISTVHLARLIEKILQGGVSLTLFVVSTSNQILDLRIRVFGDRDYELGRLKLFDQRRM